MKPIFTMIMVLVIQFSLANLVDENLEEKDENIHFKDEFYLGLYIFFWVVAIDISIFTVIFFKTNLKWLEFHATTNLIIVLGSLLNNILLINRNKVGLSDQFVQLELVCFLLEISQILTSNRIYLLRKLKEIPPKLKFYRNAHKATGFIIYFFHKIHLL